MARLCCRGMCKNLLPSDGQQQNYSKAKFPSNLNCGQKILSETGPRPGSHIDELPFLAYAPDQSLCIITALSHYLECTLSLKGSETPLFLTLRKPHKAASRDTLHGWVKIALVDAGIDMQIFKPHSIPSATTNFVARSKLFLGTILHTASCFRETTFSRYYKMPIQSNFSQHIVTHSK